MNFSEDNYSKQGPKIRAIMRQIGNGLIWRVYSLNLNVADIKDIEGSGIGPVHDSWHVFWNRVEERSSQIDLINFTCNMTLTLAYAENKRANK